MDRRKFLKDLAVMTAATRCLPDSVKSGEHSDGVTDLGEAFEASASSTASLDIKGHTLISEFKIDATVWKVYEDLRTREGAITLVSSKDGTRVLRKSAEASFPEAGPAYLGLDLKDIGTTASDLLADRLLASGGDPDPLMVMSAAPPLGSTSSEHPSWRLPWDTIVGTKECFDTMPVFPAGSTRTYHPVQYFPELTNKAAAKRFDGLVGGWMPAVRKVITVSESAYDEVLVFGDVQARDKFIVQTWHRTARVENGKITKVVYGYSYPGFRRGVKTLAPKSSTVRSMLSPATGTSCCSDFSPASLPVNDWIDMSKHAFAKELMVRPGGVYPKYGAVDRDYYGSEYDGFQDIFTMSVYANLEWGRFEMARAVIDNFFTDFVDAKGLNNMRGPEIAQFGLTLSLLATILQLHGRLCLVAETSRQDRSDGGFAGRATRGKPALAAGRSRLRIDPRLERIGFLSGPEANDLVAALLREQRIFCAGAQGHRSSLDRDQPIEALASYGEVSGRLDEAQQVLQDALVASMEKNVRKDMHPPYIGPFPGTTLTFWESMQKEKPSPQQWVHRAYAELLQADVLPASLANIVIDCMRAYGATTLGVVANVEPPHPDGRDISDSSPMAMRRCCCAWTALKNTCCSSTRTATMTTLGGVGLPVK